MSRIKNQNTVKTNKQGFIPCNRTKDWQALTTEAKALKRTHLRTLFGSETATKFRLEKFSLTREGIFFDYSKNKINLKTRDQLIALFKTMGGPVAIKAMFSGKTINWTENRSVLHTLLRSSKKNFILKGENQTKLIQDVFKKMEHFSEQVRSGRWKGFTGKAITDVVNIGIGGSFLGPKMCVRALHRYSRKLNVHFVSNIDGNDISYVLKNLHPETTLFLIASKTFTTEETMTNAEIAKKWILTSLGKKKSTKIAKSAKSKQQAMVARHFACMSTNEKAVVDFGIDRKNMFVFWEYVGGRYSIWSAIGLPLMLSIGPKGFREFLAGGEAMDNHFKHTAPEKNLPILLALMSIWNNNFLNNASHLVIPYCSDLAYFTDYLQQMDMESNGKQVNRANKRVSYQTGNILWGQTGTDCQHSFFQLLHQGTRTSSVDFIGVLKHAHNYKNSHERLLANLLAQSESLAFGLTPEATLQNILAERNTTTVTAEIKALLPHRVFDGDRPSSLIIIDELTPKNLGKLIALYEHKVFVEGIIWGINSYDQWGVELGKKVAKKIVPLIKGRAVKDPKVAPHPSTVALLKSLKIVK